MFKITSFLLITFLLLSCQEDKLSTITKAPIPALENVRIKNGRLCFPSQKEFTVTELAINSQTSLDLSNWQKEIDFVSMKKLHNEVNEDFSTVESMNDYRTFLTNHQKYLHITNDSSISINGYQPFFSNLLNTDGEVYIGNSLIKYTNSHYIKIEDGSEAKLQEALNTLQTDKTKGIYVETRSYNTSNARSCSPNEVWQTCFSGWWHRATGHYRIDNNFGTVNSSSSVVELTTFFRATIRAEYKGFLGFWYKEQTNITWNVGWGAIALDNTQSPDLTHGTGWTANNLSEVNYSYPIRPITSSLTLRWDQLRQYTYDFDYCFSTITTPLMSCSENCP